VATTLANNEFDVVHRLGRNHGNADALSRAPHLIEDPSLELDILIGEKIGAVICSLQAEEAWTPDLVCEGQEQGEELAEVRKWVLERTKPTNLRHSALTAEGKKLAGLFDSLYLDKDRVLRYDFTYGQEMGLPEVRHLIVLPESMRRGAIERAHHAVAHKAVEATVAELHKTVYFAGMYRWVNETLRRCEICQVKKGSIPNQRGLLVSHVTGYPFQKISIDFVGPLPRSKKGNEYMLTVSDSFTRWLEAFPCCRANAQVVVNKLITEIFPRFGVCDQIHSDRGTQFLSDLVSEVVAALGIRHQASGIMSPPGLRRSPPCLEEMHQPPWRWSSELLPLCQKTQLICTNTRPTCAVGWQRRTPMYARTCAARSTGSVRLTTRTDAPTSPPSLCGCGRPDSGRASPESVLDQSVADQTSAKRTDVRNHAPPQLGKARL
jgi:hypothetical protein